VLFFSFLAFTLRCDGACICFPSLLCFPLRRSCNVCWDGEFVPAERFACFREREGECELLEALLVRNIDFRGPGAKYRNLMRLHL
jgi:hypothetical protein